MKHKHFNRLLSMLLVVATLFGLMAVPASAAVQISSCRLLSSPDSVCSSARSLAVSGKHACRSSRRQRRVPRARSVSKAPRKIFSD